MKGEIVRSIKCNSTDAKKNSLIKLNDFFEDKPTQNSTHISSFKDKEKVREFKSSQTKSNKIHKTNMTDLNSRQNKPTYKQEKKSKVFIKST